ncbi:dolichol-phosphate mannosyltransferase [Roseimicrobium gellanilyticum]|uniref:Dolichol-phosphate mannosyltransferase n=1 Tax=Roseimicrobium gellanilyticum TaxID=748857 RepID=A0A366HLY4_9BACT|nr:glycosyltransferase family 2 protein [Roseimicrobium gellanilyticum]RBP43940.1 dolichol-phosphate mannosyltransferase [Roseimicrobium gellanilyticum]
MPESLNPKPVQLLSVVIPARDEEGSVAHTVEELHQTLSARQISHEIVVVNDGSQDGTWGLLQELSQRIPTLRPVNNTGPNGFGRAIICGLNHMLGDAVVIMMADCSDSPAEVVQYWDLLNQGHECVFGSRFIKGGGVHDYPTHKLILNRIANWGIKVLFRIPLNDTTNAFKAYRAEVIEGCRPFIAPHFNLTVEIPLKAIVRGYTWTTMPITWRNRRAGVPKLKIKEMGSRYLFIILYVWLEKFFSRGDYRRQIQPTSKEKSP